MSADYVSLSHCWGKSPAYKTEILSLLDRRRGMSVVEMPKTFRDAVAITRNLGLQYLWIDSLCIIQDSAVDWARESAQMGRIYRDAAITIFAESSDSDAGGCFASRPQTGKTSALYRTPMLDALMDLFSEQRGCPGSSFVQQKLHHAGSHSLPEQYSIFESAKRLIVMEGLTPLSSRGWVLQESILSFRSLTYDQHEVRWACPTMIACECIPEGHARKSWSRFDKGDVDVVEERSLFNAWATIVNEFSLRRLTFGKDKLPALAGIVSEMCLHRTSTTYVAGLWEDTLRRDLAWFVPPRSTSAPYRQTCRTQGCQAPSWSWAMVEGPVRMHLEHSDGTKTKEDTDTQRSNRAEPLECEILRCSSTPISTLNPFGDCSGILKLRGRLGHARCCAPISTTFYVDRIPLEDTWSGRETAWFDPDVTPVPKATATDEIWCMPLYHKGAELWCLALRPVSKGQASHTVGGHSTVRNEVYKRVGVVRAKYISLHDISAEPMKHFSAIAEHNTAMLAWFEQCEVKTINVV